MDPHEIAQIVKLALRFQVILLRVECGITLLDMLQDQLRMKISHAKHKRDLQKALLSIEYPGEETENHVTIPVVDLRPLLAVSSIIEIKPSEHFANDGGLLRHVLIIVWRLLNFLKIIIVSTLEL